MAPRPTRIKKRELLAWALAAIATIAALSTAALYFSPCARVFRVISEGKVLLWFEAGVPKTLFGTRVLTLTEFRNHYAVTADGQRFLINSTIEETSATPFSVVVNWTADLKR